MPDLFAPGAAEALVLISTRLGAMMLIAPIFSARVMPVMLRTCLVVLLTVLLFPVAYAHVDGAHLQLSGATAATEALIGFAVGLGAALLVGAAEVMGDLLAVHTGLSAAASLDPLTNQHSPTLGKFANLFAVTLLLSLDAHHGIIDALARTLEVLPPGSSIDAPLGMGAMVRSCAVLFAMGVQLALPVVAVVSLGNVAVGVLSRVAPQLNVLAVSFPLQIGLGLIAFATALPLIASTMASWATAYGGILGQVLGAFGAAGTR